MVKRASRFEVLIRFGSLVDGIARLATGKGVCVVYDRNGSIDLPKTAFEEVSKILGGTFMELEAGTHRSARRYCVRSPKQVRSVQGKYTSAASLVACESRRHRLLRTWAGPWWSGR